MAMIWRLCFEGPGRIREGAWWLKQQVERHLREWSAYITELEVDGSRDPPNGQAPQAQEPRWLRQLHLSRGEPWDALTLEGLNCTSCCRPQILCLVAAEPLSTSYLSAGRTAVPLENGIINILSCRRPFAYSI